MTSRKCIECIKSNYILSHRVASFPWKIWKPGQIGESKMEKGGEELQDF